MFKATTLRIKQRHGYLAQLHLLLSLLVVVGCVQSPDPVAEDIVKIGPPKFSNGLDHGDFLSPSISYTLTGTCDSQASLSEYSFDEATWIPFTCTNDIFALSVNLTPRATVFMRAKGKFTYSSTSRANLRFVPPQTSSAIVAAVSSRSDSSDKVGVGTQNTISSNFSGETLTGTSKVVQTLMPRLIYETQ